MHSPDICYEQVEGALQLIFPPPEASSNLISFVWKSLIIGTFLVINWVDHSESITFFSSNLAIICFFKPQLSIYSIHSNLLGASTVVRAIYLETTEHMWKTKGDPVLLWTHTKNSEEGITDKKVIPVRMITLLEQSALLSPMYKSNCHRYQDFREPSLSFEKAPTCISSASYQRWARWTY